MIRILFILLNILYLPCAFAQLESGNIRPYSKESPWNTPIKKSARYHPQSDAYIKQLAQSGYLGSNPYSWTMPVYIVDKSTPKTSIHVKNWYSEVSENNTILRKLRNSKISIPMPSNAQPALGSDAQIILWNPQTGEEWGFWQVKRKDSQWEAVNGYYYNTHWSGIPPKGFISRGAGVPYLIGLIRPWEIQEGAIEHAIAFATSLPSKEFIFPATKTDGKGNFPDMPMGTRLQLDPNLTEKDFDQWELSKTGKIIAKAMQKYGLIIIDGSGHPKIYAEFEGTAHWKGLINKRTIDAIPYKHFKVLLPENE